MRLTSFGYNNTGFWPSPNWILDLLYPEYFPLGHLFDYHKNKPEMTEFSPRIVCQKPNSLSLFDTLSRSVSRKCRLELANHFLARHQDWIEGMFTVYYEYNYLILSRHSKWLILWSPWPIHHGLAFGHLRNPPTEARIGNLGNTLRVKFHRRNLVFNKK